MRKLPVVALAALPQIAGLHPALAAQASAAPACRALANATALDFWIGAWKVTGAKDGSFQGTDTVERVLDGCAVVETWHGAEANDEGQSLFVYDANAQSWEQVWVTTDTSRPGGLKHKRLVATYPDGGTRFEGQLPLPGGRTILDRTTLTPMADGRVRQVIEDSKDGGASWIVSFDAFYTRASVTKL